MSYPCHLRRLILEGFDALQLSNGQISLTVIPALGGKISSIQPLPSQHEWLWRNPHLPYTAPQYAASFLGMWPVWPGWDNWAVLQAGGQAGRSLLALLVLSLRGVIGLGWAFDGSSYLLLGIFAAIYLYCLRQAVKAVISKQVSVATHHAPNLLTRQSSTAPAPPSTSSGRDLLPHSPAFVPVASAFFVLFWYVLLVAPVFHAWYLLWFIPLAPLLLPHRRPLNAAIVFSITALLMIPYFETIRVWYPLLLSNQWLGHAVGVPLLLIPPVLALFWPVKPESHSRHLP